MIADGFACVPSILAIRTMQGLSAPHLQVVGSTHEAAGAPEGAILQWPKVKDPEPSLQIQLYTLHAAENDGNIETSRGGIPHAAVCHKTNGVLKLKRGST